MPKTIAIKFYVDIALGIIGIALILWGLAL